MNKKEQLLIKLKKLADEGVGGEKTSAEKLLKQLLRKYGLTEEDLHSEKEERFELSFRGTYEKKLLAQIYYFVTGKNTAHIIKNKLILIITPSDKIEIVAMFQFYKKALKDDMELFYDAFIAKNNIYPETVESNELIEPDMQRFYKIMNIVQGLDKHNYLKSIAKK